MGKSRAYNIYEVRCMKIQWKKLLICILIPLAVGGLSALSTSGSMDLYQSINRPALAPPSWLFPVAWTILYILMGIASYLVFTSDNPHKNIALDIYGIQLVFNYFWPLFFFTLEAYLFSFIWLVLLWLLILATTILFYRINKTAGYLMLPYLLWVAFAGYLNLSVYLLN